MCRSYTHPNPPLRVVLDCVSSFVSAVKDSLKRGVIRKCSFTVNFRIDVFQFLFHGKGNAVCGSHSFSYSEEDFSSEYFPSNWFIIHDKLGSGCKVVFPVLLFSSVKFSPVTYLMSDTTPIPQHRDFAETVSVTLVKCRC